MRTATAQLPEIDASDDKVFTTRNAVIMLDGASAFAPVPIAPSTYADRLGRHLQDTLTSEPGANLVIALAEAITDTARRLDLHEHHSPSSTVTIARQDDATLDLLILGDNLVMLQDETLTDPRMDNLNLAARTKYRERLAHGSGYDEEHRAILRQLQTQQAHYRNQSGGYWIAEANPDAAAQAIIAQRPVTDVSAVILATDGAYNTMRHLGHTDWDTLSHADDAQLQNILEQCQIWEAEHDPHGQQLPRSKRHDDKTIAVLDLAA